MLPRQNKHNRLVHLIKEKAVSKGKFTLASGVKSDYYVDLSKITFRYNVLQTIVSQITEQDINWEDVSKIGGPAIGAIPLVVGLMDMLDIDGFIIRSEKKEHGKKDLIEGCLEENDVVVLVEDVTTSGGSLLKAVKAVQKFGCAVNHVISVLDRNQGAKELFEKEKIPFTYLVSIDEVL